MKRVNKVLYTTNDFSNIPIPSDCTRCSLRSEGCHVGHPIIIPTYDCRISYCNTYGKRYPFMFNF